MISPSMLRFAPILFLTWIAAAQTGKPLMTLDEFFDAVYISNVRTSPDGHAVVIETLRPDWEGERYRNDLWLYRDEGAGSLVQLTRSGHDHAPQWSPDGKWVAFLSDRAGNGEKGEKTDQLWLIAFGGGEPLAVTHGDEKVHAFAWASDSRRIFFATRTPWTKEQQESYKKDWKDVVEFRESERGDAIALIEATTGAMKPVTETPWRVKQMEASPDGRSLAFLTDSISERQEFMEAYGIYLVDAGGGKPRTLLQRPAVLDSVHWAPDGKHILFSFLNGSVEGK